MMKALRKAIIHRSKLKKITTGQEPEIAESKGEKNNLQIIVGQTELNYHEVM